MTAPRSPVALACLAFVCSGLLMTGPGASSYAAEPFPTPTVATRAAGSVGAAAARVDTPTVLSSRTFGHSVRRHALRAYEMGSRQAEPTVVFIAAMHGNETEGSTVISALMGGRPIRGIHLWVIRRDNPDGVLSGHRRNAHGVDLNRNFPTKWKRLTGNDNSGPRPASEPETRNLMRFLNRINPDVVVTMHSPLHGIDVYDAKNRQLAGRLARQMRLPIRDFDCGGVCHGTLTQWFNKNHRGACVTVEFGDNPSSRYLHVGAPRGLVRAVGGRFMTS